MLTLADIRLKSPAKVNLFFRVLKKREDGFHEIASLYHAIDLFDHITIKPSLEDTLTCTDSSIPLGKENLIWKAVDLFRSEINTDKKFSIYLEKNIPSEAGLGGGSSNAASALWGLNEMFGKPLSVDELMNLGSSIGSDVSFFLSNGCAYCTGRGENIENIPPLQRESFYILKPSFGMSTPKVYKGINVQELKPRDPKETLNLFLQGQDANYNDLEVSAFKIEEKQKLLVEYLNQIFEKAVMTGSGSSVMCWGAPDEESLKEHSLFEVSLASRAHDNWY